MYVHQLVYYKIIRRCARCSDKNSYELFQEVLKKGEKCIVV